MNFWKLSKVSQLFKFSISSRSIKNVIDIVSGITIKTYHSAITATSNNMIHTHYHLQFSLLQILVLMKMLKFSFISIQPSYEIKVFHIFVFNKRLRFNSTSISSKRVKGYKRFPQFSFTPLICVNFSIHLNLKCLRWEVKMLK